MEKKERLSAMCFLGAAIAFYVCAIMYFLDKESSMGVVYLCLGSTNLCLASVHINKNKSNKEK